MSAEVKLSLPVDSKLHSVDVTATKQAWIWAVGPKVTRSSDNNENDKRDGSTGGFDQHSSYGE